MVFEIPNRLQNFPIANTAENIHFLIAYLFHGEISTLFAESLHIARDSHLLKYGESL
jgi:hypothetical protein